MVFPNKPRTTKNTKTIIVAAGLFKVDPFVKVFEKILEPNILLFMNIRLIQKSLFKF